MDPTTQPIEPGAVIAPVPGLDGASASPIPPTARAEVRPGEEDVGPQRLCRGAGCLAEDPEGVWWPEDPEFFYVTRSGDRIAGYDSICRACRAEKRQAEPRIERPRVVELAPGEVIDRDEYKRRWDRLRYAAMTPEERAAKLESDRVRRRVRRAAIRIAREAVSA